MSKAKYDRDQIMDALNAKDIDSPCHRCGYDGIFALIDGFSKFPLSFDLENEIDDNVPVILTGCNNCGAITPHALYALVNREDVIIKEEKNGK